jgi:hypothetical protein
MKKILFLAASATLLFACKKDDDKQKEFKSAEVSLHDGKAWSVVTLDKKGAPLQLSLVMNEAVLNSVPVGGDGDGHGPEHGNDIFIPLHNKAKQSTPFQSIMLNWNQNGHEPSGIYDLPHFDFHFYTSEQAEIMNYTDPVKLDQNLPAAEYVPTNFIAGPSVPMMGKHWIDVTSPELNGATFTQTLLYGSYDSKLIFVEPMITLNFLKNTNSFERPIPQPAKFKTAGYYPTKLRIVKRNGTTEIILDGFTYRSAS